MFQTSYTISFIFAMKSINFFVGFVKQNCNGYEISFTSHQHFIYL